MEAKYIIIKRAVWEKIYLLANGVIDWDDAPFDVDEATLNERARQCCEEVLRADSRLLYASA